jgi:threonine synthase
MLIDRSGRRYGYEEPRWRGDDGSPLMVEPLPGITRAQLVDRRDHWRYAAALPAPIPPLTLGEGRTPLLPFADDVWVKPEWFNPTASFKDRGTSVMLAFLSHQKIDSILEDSSGNGGSSVAAYAAAAGLRATILAPESTSPAKIRQSRAHGATVELVPGDRQATAREAESRAGSTFYASHNWHPFFLQGTKLLAYEIWEDLGFTAPDAVVVPCGAGSLVLGCAIGFAELRRANQIERVPRLLVSQPENCAPLAAAFHGRPPEDARRTIAEGTAIAQPVRAEEVLEAIRDSNGDMITVPEPEIAAATLELARRGLYAEPTSAQVLPALRKLGPQGRTVMILTGSALKSPDVVGTLLA